MKKADLYMVLVANNDGNGNFTHKAFGVEIYAPNEVAFEPLLDADVAYPNSIPFWETKNGVLFCLSYLTDDAPLLVQRKFFPCLHGAQHVGNIFWNAYFTTERHAKRLAIDLLDSVDFHCDGEWSENVDKLAEEVSAAEQARRDFEAHPKLPLLTKGGMPLSAD